MLFWRLSYTASCLGQTLIEILMNMRQTLQFVMYKLSVIFTVSLPLLSWMALVSPPTNGIACFFLSIIVIKVFLSLDWRTNLWQTDSSSFFNKKLKNENEKLSFNSCLLIYFFTIIRKVFWHMYTSITIGYDS